VAKYEAAEPTRSSEEPHLESSANGEQLADSLWVALPQFLDVAREPLAVPVLAVVPEQPLEDARWFTK
jgi:hypothetical protein